jgi:hypothetical protein
MYIPQSLSPARRLTPILVLDKRLPHQARRKAPVRNQTLQLGIKVYAMVRGLLCLDSDQDQFEDVFLFR